MICRWFNRWRERNRVQFTFGVWQGQQLKQQQRSAISGSSNSASNSATLRALRHMPVNLTTDRPARRTAAGTSCTSSSTSSTAAASTAASVSGGDNDKSRKIGTNVAADEEAVSTGSEGDRESANGSGSAEEGGGVSATSATSAAEGEDSDDGSSDDDIESEEKAKEKVQKNKSAPRRVSLRWPCPYSYTLQHIVNERYDGYYCPPLPLDSEDVPGKSAQDAGIFGAPGDSCNNKWLCIYKDLTESLNEGTRKRQCVK